jgi:septal ring factor EnvC (AmiA/AmiB activator)
MPTQSRAEKAQTALATADRKADRLQKQLAELRKELEDVTARLDETIRRRDYLAMDPDLATPNGKPAAKADDPNPAFQRSVDHR